MTDSGPAAAPNHGSTVMIHYPDVRPRLLRWLPPRCSCGVWRYDRCPDRPHAADPAPAAPLLGVLLAVLVVAGAVVYGAAKAVGWP